MRESMKPIHLAGSVLNRTRHVCAFFNSREEEYELLVPFMKEGFECGESSAITQWWGSMEWALIDMPGVEDLIEYESRLNDFLPDYDDVVVCTYDLNKFSANVVMDVMHTHPIVIIGGILQENSFYVPPEEFLRELRGSEN